MKLYIFGNGFDIAHDFKTSYKDFRNYLINKNRDDILYLFPDEDLWSNFEYNVCAIDHEVFKGLVKEYKEISEGICEEIFDDISKEMATFLNEIDYKSKYVYEIEKNSLFFVFNYTHTLEMLYDVDSSRIYQPHGSIGEYLYFNKKLILGHHKHEYLVNPELTSGKYFDHYYAFNVYTEKPVEKIIDSKEMIDFLSMIEMNEIDEVIFYGFSYSIVDEDYIVKIKEKLNDNTMFLLGYHSPSDKINAMEFVKRLSIRNYKILNNNVLIKRMEVRD